MNIATFLETAAGRILSDAATYARTLPALANAEEAVLRDHLPELLQAITADLGRPQSRTESIQRSHGDAPAADHETAAQAHGLARAQSGITTSQLVAEYRALRSSVLRLYGEAYSSVPAALEEIGRFNEAIDQAVAESVLFHEKQLERWRQIFLGVLGHDLRGPLNAISLAGRLIALQAPPALSAHAATLSHGVERMTALLDSLLELNRAGLGERMTLRRASSDLHAACTAELDLLRAAFPGTKIELEAQGDTQGEFDASRLREALCNLVMNAVKHGSSTDPVIVTLEGQESTVLLSVENIAAEEIPAGEMERWFEPLHRRDAQPAGSRHAHLGLGLFIVRQIARAHGGEVEGHSAGRTVRFTITIPKSPTAKGD
ncbi:HAMP domain-containing histidine kinase [Variovorax paradoxus]|nr:HAMP domain-containing histidine kinase [Variovorax paradoxus]